MAKSYQKPTTLRHTFLVGYRMTLSFLLNEGGQVDGEYPIYTLESSDGTYSRKLSAGSDLVANGDYMQLIFDKLIPGLSYKLTRLIEEDMQEVVFDNTAFGSIVDQDRDVQQKLDNHAYGELDVITGSEVESLCFEPQSDSSGDSASSDDSDSFDAADAAGSGAQEG